MHALPLAIGKCLNFGVKIAQAHQDAVFTILKSIAVAIVAGRSAPAQEDFDPVKMMPDTHRVLFENTLVRVIEGRVPAAGYEPKHRHPHRIEGPDFADNVGSS